MGPFRTPDKKALSAASAASVKKNDLKEKRKQKLQTKATILAAVAPEKSTYRDSLISQEEASRVQVNQSARQLRRVSSDTTVAKCLRDNFGDFSSAEVDLVLVDGMSLRETLKRDKGLQKMGQLTMGKHYYEKLRSKFRSSQEGAARLAVKDRSESCPNDLWTALDMLTAKVKKCQPLQDWLEATYCSILLKMMSMLLVSMCMFGVAFIRCCECSGMLIEHI
jgi:hypothetical protein